MRKLSKRYSLLAGTILAIFAIFALWPGFVIDSYIRLRLLFDRDQVPLQEQTNTTFDTLSQIDFTIPTTTETSTEAFLPIETNDGQLIIPTIGVDGPVIISKTQDVLNRGFWHIPGSALPGQKGNIVISSHRWLHRPPHPVTFYRIDELELGDSIYYSYGGKRYTYTVTETKIVEPTDVDILAQDENKLTLFTCHPLFSTSQRYVVIAKLVSVDDIDSTE